MNEERKQILDLAAIRQRLAEARGPRYWRSLEEVAETKEFQEFLENEFPQHARPFNAQLDRRDFVKLVGLSLALAGMTGCRYLPQEKIVPYVIAPEEMVQGKPLWYATACTRGGYATGLLVESHEGRPTKIEGNPNHPASPAAIPGNANHPANPGSVDIFSLASIYHLYDPDRSQNLVNKGEMDYWDAFLAQARPRMAKLKEKQGAGLWILTESVSSPTLAAMMAKILREYPQAKWRQFEPLARDNVHAGVKMALGKDANVYYDLSKADIILSLDCNFLTDLPGSVRYARDFAEKRKVREGTKKMSRLYAIETTPSPLSFVADHRWSLRPADIEGAARAVAQRLGISVQTAAYQPPVNLDAARWDAILEEIVNDLKSAPQGTTLVLAGDSQPPVVHALALAINQALGNIGQSVRITAPVLQKAPDQPGYVNSAAALREVTDALNSGQADTLLILGANPVYHAPADIPFKEALDKFARAAAPDGTLQHFTVHLGFYQDETAELCQWHIPEAHFLEAWGDARAYDGTASIIQPLIEPLYNGRSALELLEAITTPLPKGGYELVRQTWLQHYRQQRISTKFDAWWKEVLHNGVVPDTSLPMETAAQISMNYAAQAPAPASQGMAIQFQPDPTVLDGRFANNGWLQELPKPMTKLTWDNVAIVSIKTAAKNNLTKGDRLELNYKGRTVVAPVWILPGQPEDTVTVQLGYGRTRAGSFGNDIGFNAYALRTSDAPWFGDGLQIKKLIGQHDLVATEYHHSIKTNEVLTERGRDIIREGTLAEFLKDPHLEHEHGHAAHMDTTATLYNPDEFKWEGKGAYKWAMAIDLNSCIGCNACVIACQSENNIPVIGKDQVKRQRAMQWIRIDRYYTGSDLDNPQMTPHPVTCMHCEQAPCEPVCPVAATVHSHEGLNQMVYNRCVGTRYCSNNCPYKVRRFNFLNYANHHDVPIKKLLANPNVTVRGRGVMEKCTYCVQRINAARIEAKKTSREIQDGEVITACQSACPTNVIHFGDLNDPNSQISKLRRQPHMYGLLEELGTRPRTTYLAKLRNPNPRLVTE
jgi:MoCo/4Fe-4S cofactor protein with predicted Tat translocation signal